jgi:phospholipid/cholesterol/gamma-HCH transport system substrate-binding protein
MKLSPRRVALELRRGGRPLRWLLLLWVVAAGAAVATVSRQEFISPFTSHEHVQVALQNATGVVPGKTEVRVAGVQVGLVQSVRLVDGRPRLTLALDPAVGPIYRDAQARLAAITPLQDMYLDLDPGTRASGLLGPGAITSTGAGGAVNIADILDAFDGDQRRQLSTLLDQLGKGLPDGGVKLQAAFAELVPLMQDSVQITRQIDGEHRQIAQAVHNLGLITLLLARHDRQLASLLNDGAGTLNTLAADDRPLDATLRALPTTIEALRSGLGQVAGAIGAIDPALHELQPAARTLAPALNALRGFAAQARPSLDALAPAADQLVPLSATLKQFAGASRGATLALSPETATINALTATTVQCLDPLGAFVDRFVSANKLGNSKGTWWRIQVVNGNTGTPIKTCADGRPNR